MKISGSISPCTWIILKEVLKNTTIYAESDPNLGYKYTIKIPMR